MYQPIPSFDFVAPIMVAVTILFVCVIIFIKFGIQNKDERLFRGAGISVLLMILIMGLGYPPANANQEVRLAVMENNILEKYNGKYYSGYLKDVEFSRNGGKGEQGKYFKITYNDLTSETFLFKFHYKTGEPRCSCVMKKDPNGIVPEK